MTGRFLGPVLAAAAVAGITGLLLGTSTRQPVDDVPGTGDEVLGPGQVVVEIGIEHSRFSVDRLEVRPGSTVRFVVRNTDPIAHELIIGDDQVHRRHAGGTEAFHRPVAGELSVGPKETGSTTYTFDEPGTVVFACHLPGHLAYGMEGEIVVSES